MGLLLGWIMKTYYYFCFFVVLLLFFFSRYLLDVESETEAALPKTKLSNAVKEVASHPVLQPVNDDHKSDYSTTDFYALSMLLVEHAKSGDVLAQFKLGKVIGYCTTINRLMKGVDSDLLLFVSLSSNAAEQNYFQQLYDDKQQCSLFFNNDYALFQDDGQTAASWNELQKYWLVKAYSHGYTAATAELMALPEMTFNSELQFETVLADIQQKLQNLEPVAMMSVLYMPDLLVGDEYFSAFAYGCSSATNTENCGLAQEKTPEVFERIEILSARLSMFDACYASFNDKTNLQRTLQQTERLFDCVRSPNFDHFIDIISPVKEGALRPSVDVAIKRIRQINAAQIRHSFTANGWKVVDSHPN
jgi:hypothetical protein